MSEHHPLAVSVENLRKEYPSGSGVLTVLNGLSFQIKSGEIVGVIGESGSGKSTLLHLLGTLDTPTSGRILISNQDPFQHSDTELSHFRNRHIGFVFQHNNLLAEFTALENVMMPSLIAGHSSSASRQRAHDLLSQVGLQSRMKHYPGQLSGGEQQRVAIARALMNQPTLLLADEPSGNLDSKNAARIHELFLQVNMRLRTTIIVVTHNLEFAGMLPRRLMMQDGRLKNDQ